MILNHWGYANMGLTDESYVSTGRVCQHEYGGFSFFYRGMRLRG